MNTHIIIPARWGATRFPGKLVEELYGKTVIQRTWEACIESGIPVTVATDDYRIRDNVVAFGGEFVMTAIGHRDGTERCEEAARAIGLSDDCKIINVQGDEPFTTPAMLRRLLECMYISETNDIGTLVSRVRTLEELHSKTTAKVILTAPGQIMRALYFSRFPVPYCVAGPEQVDVTISDYWRHVGIYAYRYATLKKIVALPPSWLARNENLEQLRWLENGYRIVVAETVHRGVAIDTPEDLQEARRLWKSS